LGLQKYHAGGERQRLPITLKGNAQTFPDGCAGREMEKTNANSKRNFDGGGKLPNGNEANDMISIKDFVEFKPPMAKRECDQCGEKLMQETWLFDIESDSWVCSWRCAELFTADYNGGEAEARSCKL
jgi:hypothetical protein